MPTLTLAELNKTVSGLSRQLGQLEKLTESNAELTLDLNNLRDELKAANEKISQLALNAQNLEQKEQNLEQGFNALKGEIVTGHKIDAWTPYPVLSAYWISPHWQYYEHPAEGDMTAYESIVTSMRVLNFSRFTTANVMIIVYDKLGNRLSNLFAEYRIPPHSTVTHRICAPGLQERGWLAISADAPVYPTGEIHYIDIIGARLVDSDVERRTQNSVAVNMTFYPNIVEPYKIDDTYTEDVNPD